MRFGRGIDAGHDDRFVDMYVNELTCDYGDEGRQAVEELLRRGEAIGAFPEPVRLDYVLAWSLSCARAASGVTPLSTHAADACICSYECTFCRVCASALEPIRPDCGAELVRRPRRTPG